MSLALAAAAVVAAPPGSGATGESVSVTVTGLRNSHGQVLACLTARAASFPDCRSDPMAHKLSAPAGTRQAPGAALTLDFGRLPPGTYAIALFHDENANGRLDKLMMMPREGFGFSRDAKVRFGPPRFAAAAFAVGAAPVHQSIRMRYMF